MRADTRLSDRLEYIGATWAIPAVVVDVAHNPEAAVSLAENLATSGPFDRTFAVFTMLGDKDVADVIMRSIRASTSG